jgi:hypothetical protein
LQRWPSNWQHRKLAAIQMLYLMFVRLTGWLALLPAEMTSLLLQFLK